jgi:peptidoglycan/LPS O-acetylase OafA/YrhL
VGLLVFLAPFLSAKSSHLYPAIMLMLPFIIVATVLARGAAPLPAVALLSGVGLISYSLYLWQAVFTSWPTAYASWFAPVSYLAIPVAWMSFRFVEKPCMNLARRLTARLTAPGRVHLMRLPSA